jgi:hypothetical protein
MYRLLLLMVAAAATQFSYTLFVPAIFSFKIIAALRAQQVTKDAASIRSSMLLPSKAVDAVQEATAPSDSAANDALSWQGSTAAFLIRNYPSSDLDITVITRSFKAVMRIRMLVLR